MSQNRTTLIIDANTTGAETGVRRLATEMSGARRLATDLSGAFNSLNASITGTNTMMGALRNLMGTLGFGIGIHELTQYMDAWVTLEARLKLVTNTYQELKTAKEGVFDIAQETRASLKDTGDLYYKVASGTKELKLSQEQILQHVKTVNQAILLSGSTAESSKAALTQYNQSVVSGVFQADEWRSIREQAPVLARLIRENLKVGENTFGATALQFKLMMADGLITTEKVVAAIERGGSKIDAQAKSIPLTIEQAWTKLNNEMIKFVGEQGQSTGVFSAVSHGIELIANNIDHLINTLGIGVASWSAYKAMVFLNIEGMVAAGKANEIRLAGIAAETAAVEANTAVKLANAKANALSTESMVAKSASDGISASTTAISSEAQLAAALTATNIARSEAVVASRQMALMQGHLRESSTAFAIAESAATSASQARVVAQAELDAVIAASSGLNATLSRQLFIETDVINKLRVAEAAELAAKNTLIAAIEREALVNDNLIRTQSQETVALNTLAAAEIRLAEAKLASTDAAAAKLAANRADIANQFKLALANAEVTAATTANTIAVEANTIAQAESAFAASYTGKAFGFLKAIVIGVKDEVVLLTAAMMRNPWVAAATALAALATAAYAYRDSLIELQGEHVTLSSAIKASWDTITEPSKNWFNSMGNYIDELLNKFEPLTEKIKSLVPNSVSAIDSGFGIVSDFMMSGGLLKMAFPNVGKDAAKIDAQNKLTTELEKAKDQNTKEELAKSGWIDKAFEAEKASKSITSVENFNKEIKRLQDEKLAIITGSEKDISTTQAQILTAKNENEKKRFVENLATLNRLRESGIQYEDSRIAEEIKKRDEFATRQIKSENNLQAEISAKRKNMTAEQKNMLEGLAQQYQIPPSFLQGLATVESAFKPLATSEKGAKGLFQVMPFNFDKIGASMKDVANESVFTAKSMKLVADVYQKSGGDVEKFWMIWNAGHVSKSIELAPPETRAGLPKLLEAIKQAGGDVGKLNELAREHEQTTKKVADEKQRLYENTAIGKYLTDMEQLNRLYDDKTSVTYQENAQKIADTFLKSTVDLNAYNEAIKKHQAILDHVVDYNYTIDESQRNLARGAITPAQHGLNVAQANAGLMNQVTDKQIPVERVGEVVDAKNILSAETATKSFHDEITKTTAAFDTLGNNGKMAFDGLLGGISAVASAATSFGEEMTKLNDNFAKGSQSYIDYMKRADISDQQRKDATADYYKMKDRYESASFIAEISGARQIAGATSKLFSEKSAARKAFHGIEMGLAVVEMAMSAKKMIVDVAAGAANMFAQGGFAGFAGVAAMAAVMGGLGFAMSGGSSEPKDMRQMKETGTTGSVLGDSEKSSNSIGNSLTLLNDTSNKQLLELQDLNANFTALVKGVDKTVTQAIALHGSFTPSTQGMSQSAKNPLGSGVAIGTSLATSAAIGATGIVAEAGLAAGSALVTAGAETIGTAIGSAAASSAAMASSIGGAMGATGATATMVGGAVLGLAGGLVLMAVQYGLGKLLGIGKTKYEAIGNGIITGISEMTAQGMKDAVVAYDYSTVKATTKGWFSDTKKIYDVINGIDNEMTNAFTELFGNLGKTLYSAFGGLGISDLVQKSAVVPMMKFDLSKAKTDQEISDVMTKAINTMSDKLATEIAGGLFTPLQKSGEGMLETITRVTAEVANVSAGFARLGINMKVSGMAAIGLSDALVSLYASAPNATDGLKGFISAMTSFIDTVLTPLQKFKFSSDNWTAFAGKFNEKTGLNLNTNIANLTRDEIMTAYTATSEKLRVASEAEAVYTKQQQTVKDATNPTTATDLANQLNAVWKPIIGKSYESATWNDIPTAWKTIIEQRAIGGTDKTELYQEMKRVFDANTEKSTSAKQVLGEGFDLNQFEKGMVETKAATANAASSVAELTNSVDLLKAAFDFENKTLSIQENVLKQITSVKQTTERQRETELSQIDNEIDIRTKLTQTTVNAFDVWNKTNGNLRLTQNALQKFNYTLEDTAKLTKSLADATKYFDGFTQNIKSWVQNLKATQLGSPESQFNAAKDNFAAQMKIINGGLATSAEQKQAALSGITGVADTYIAAIRSNYASTEKGQELINQVVESVSGLTTTVDVQQLQLGVLQSIRDGVHALPTGISDTQKTFFESLATKIDTAQKTYIAAPTSTNDLIANTLAKEWTIAVDAVSKGSGFLDALIKSFDGDKGLNSAINLIIDDKSLNAVQAQTAVDNVLRNLKVVFIDNEFVAPNFLSLAQKFIDQQIDLINPPPIYLNANNDDALVKIKTTGEKLTAYNGINVNKIVEVNTTSAITNIKDLTKATNDAMSAIAALNTAKSTPISYPTALTPSDITNISPSISNLSGLGGLTAANSPVYNTPEMLQTVQPQLIQSSAYAITPAAITNVVPSINADLNSLSLSTLTKDPSIQAIIDSASAMATQKSRGGAFTEGALNAQNIVESYKANYPQYFAKGGAFTNGIVDEPTMFNMGMMGEAGTEMIMPATRMPDGSLGVRALGGGNAANDSSSDNAEMIKELKESNKELKEQNRNLAALVSVMQATLQENRKQANSLDKIQSKTRIQARQP